LSTSPEPKGSAKAAETFSIFDKRKEVHLHGEGKGRRKKKRGAGKSEMRSWLFFEELKGVFQQAPQPSYIRDKHISNSRQRTGKHC